MNPTVNFNQYSLDNYYAPGTILGTKNIEMKISETYLLKKTT